MLSIPIAHDPNSALTENQAADFLGLSVRSLQNYRAGGNGPSFTKIGRSVRYQRRALIAFQRAHTVSAHTYADSAQENAKCRS